MDDDHAGPDIAASLPHRDQMDRAFRRLTDDQRSVLILFFYADLPLADVAVALDVPVGTVKSRLNWATNALRAALEADERTPELANGWAR